MRKLLTALALLTLAACGGEATGVDALPDGPLALALVSGDGQEVQVTDTLPTDIVVRVEKGGQPLGNQLVDWTVLHDNCGAPFVTTTETDSVGQTGNRLVAGTRAWTRPDGPDVCQMEVRYALTVADTVQARVDTTVNYLVQPGPYGDGFESHAGSGGGSPFTLDWLNSYITDEYGNPALWRVEVDSVFHAQDTVYGDRGAYTLVADTPVVADTAVVCLTTPDTLLGAGIARVSADTTIFVETRAFDDSRSDIQREDCL